MTRALLVAALAATVALLPAPAPGCGLVSPAGGSTVAVGEVAVVIWDDAAGVEHFTRSALFRGTTAGFGFLVPTPGQPTLADAPGPISDRLEALTGPRVEARKRLAEFGCGAPRSTFATVGAAMPAAPAVQVVERRRVGDFDAAVLKANDPAALGNWLGANGFASRPAVTAWLGGYTADGWHLTAFKLANNPAAAVSGHLKAVRMSFPTERPYYPYDEPAAAPGPRPPGLRGFKLFVLAPARMVALSGPARGAFAVPELQAAWAGPVDGPVVEATAVACGLTAADAAKLAGRAWTLTEFEDPYGRRTPTDVYFRPSPDPSPVERPPIVIYEDLYWPYYAMAGGFVVGGPMVFWVLWRTIRRAIRHLPAAPLD